MSKEQIIFINIDDSGKMTPHEKVCVYGAIIFLSKKEKDKFITQYRQIINDIHCKYCGQDKNQGCTGKCPEIKSNNINPKDLRRIINYIKKYYLGAVTVDNLNVYDYIISSKPSKGRFLDYVLRIFIKGIIKDLIAKKVIDPHQDLHIILNIDEQPTKSNGYYNLREGLIEELRYGIKNYDYKKVYQPIMHQKVYITLSYLHSDKSYVVQAADIIAGLVRRKSTKGHLGSTILDNIFEYLNYQIFMP